MTGYVYAIESGNAVKIGWAKDPVRRLAELNVGSPGTHSLLGYARGTKAHERELHDLCRGERIRGEWFRKGRVVSLFLDHLPPAPALDERFAWQISGTKISRYITDRDLTLSDFARHAGIAGSTLFRIISGERNAGVKVAIKIEAATDGHVTLSDLRPDLYPPKSNGNGAAA